MTDIDRDVKLLERIWKGDSLDFDLWVLDLSLADDKIDQIWWEVNGFWAEATLGFGDEQQDPSIGWVGPVPGDFWSECKCWYSRILWTAKVENVKRCQKLLSLQFCSTFLHGNSNLPKRKFWSKWPQRVVHFGRPGLAFTARYSEGRRGQSSLKLRSFSASRHPV